MVQESSAAVCSELEDTDRYLLIHILYYSQRGFAANGDTFFNLDGVNLIEMKHYKIHTFSVL